MSDSPSRGTVRPGWEPVPVWTEEQPMRCTTCGHDFTGRELVYMPAMCEREACPGPGERTRVEVVPRSVADALAEFIESLNLRNPPRVLAEYRGGCVCGETSARNCPEHQNQGDATKCDIERWTIEGGSQVDRTAVVVSGPMPLRGYQIGMVRESDYEALATQLAGAVKAMRDESADLRARYSDPFASTMLGANEVADLLDTFVNQLGGR